VVALDPLLAALSMRDLLLLAGGGVLYSLGVVVHLAPRLPYHNALWHAFVVAAAACHDRSSSTSPGWPGDASGLHLPAW
jgi:hemolysin III